LVRGRADAFGVGLGIAGFSLSLVLSVAVLSLSPDLSVMSVLFPVSRFPRDDWSPPAAGRRCRDSSRASTPAADLLVVDRVAGTAGGRQAAHLADRAIDVGDGAA
jgi:hypothetical protein